MKRLLQLIVLPCLLSNGPAQTIPQFKVWEGTVGRSSLEGIVDKLRHPQAPRWPRIESAYAYEQRPENQRQVGVEALALADSLRQQMEVSFRPDAQMDEQRTARGQSLLAKCQRMGVTSTFCKCFEPVVTKEHQLSLQRPRTTTFAVFAAKVDATLRD